MSDEWDDLARRYRWRLQRLLIGEDGDGDVVFGEDYVFGDEAADFTGGSKAGDR